jgi:copper resistance protein B
LIKTAVQLWVVAGLLEVTPVWGESPANMMSGHHAHHRHHQPETVVIVENANNPQQLAPSLSNKVSGDRHYRDPNAYSDGIDFSHLAKPKMGEHALIGSLIADRLEMASARRDFSMVYDWQAWYGLDDDRLLVRAEGEIESGSFKNARNELLWAHALTAFWDTQVGIRYDSGLGQDRAWGALGVQGYAPYWLYVEATGYVGEEGRTAFRLELEYDLIITQKLILQPRIETNFYSESDPSRLVSSGLSNIEAGLRLRYEIIREFAPYIGIEWASTFGSAADKIRAQGNKPEETRFIAGVHFWF